MSKRIITLGTWESEPIEWLVLKEEGFATLVVSKYPLCSLSNDGSIWNNSALRKFLNNKFYKQAFNENEKKKVINVQLTDVNTKDNIFVLSKDEAENLMTRNERTYGNLSCQFPCKNCYKNINKNGTCWYLRTPYDSIKLREVNSNGEINNNYSHDGGLSIRPAMWIKEK